MFNIFDIYYLYIYSRASDKINEIPIGADIMLQSRFSTRKSPMGRKDAYGAMFNQ